DAEADDDEGDDRGEERVLVVPDDPADQVREAGGDSGPGHGERVAAPPGQTLVEPVPHGAARTLGHGDGGGRRRGGARRRGPSRAHAGTGSCSRISSSSSRRKVSPSRAPRPTTSGARPGSGVAPFSRALRPPSTRIT